jgi:hypothetical protein
MSFTVTGNGGDRAVTTTELILLLVAPGVLAKMQGDENA